MGAGGGPPGGGRADDGLPASGWRLDGYGISGSDVAVASRDTGLLDLVALSSGDLALYRYDMMWHSAVTIAAPPGVALRAVAAAADGQCLELIATGDNHKLYYARSSSGTGEISFESWSEIDGALTLGDPGSISLLAWPGYDRWDAFWAMPSGNIGHAWGQDGSNYAFETGDDSMAPYLATAAPAHTIEAVLSGPARIDIFADGGSRFCFQHHWYDGDHGYWGEVDALHREQRTCAARDASGNHTFESTGDFVLVSDTAGTYDVLVMDPSALRGPALRRSHVTVDAAAGPGNGVLWFDDMGALSAPPKRLVAGIAWRGPELRHDVFGVDDESSSVWQFIYP
jgi:hypothetical protein